MMLNQTGMTKTIPVLINFKIYLSIRILLYN